MGCTYMLQIHVPLWKASSSSRINVKIYAAAQDVAKTTDQVYVAISTIEQKIMWVKHS